MKLVIRHRPPRLPPALRLGRLAAQIPAWFLSPRAAALRLRRPPKAPLAASLRKSVYQDARTFIESHTARHLHFTQHFHVLMSSHLTRAQIITARAAETRSGSATLSALRHWRSARECLAPARTVSAPQPNLQAAPARRRLAVSHEVVAQPIPASRAPRSHVSLARPHRPHDAAFTEAAKATRGRAFAPRVTERAQRAARAAELIATEDRIREIAVQPRARVALRTRAQASIEARTGQRTPYAATPSRVTLTYRRAPGDTAPREHAMDLMQLANAPFAARRAPGATAGAHAAPSNYPAAANAPPRIDPAMLDGFADDIIRRIDKRARIERERRGI